MSEQPIAPFPDMQLDPELAAWHGVAQQMPGWHEGLQAHAARNLGERGLSHLVEVQPDPEPLPSAVESTPAREVIAQAFESGNKMLQRITQDPHFDVLCAKKGVDPYNTDTPAYWDTVEEFTLSHTAKLRNSGQADELKLSALELIATTPNFLAKEKHIKKAAELRDLPPEAREKSIEGKEAASRFNTRVRDFATRFPNTHASDLATSLLKAAQSADLEYSGLARNVNDQVRNVIRGAQYEMAFGQILAAMGADYRPSRDESEDLRGIDWVISDGMPQKLCVDVKASLSEVDILNRGHNNTPYHIKRTGDVVLYPLLTDAQFHDTFFISEQAAALTAPKIEAYLAQARHGN